MKSKKGIMLSQAFGAVLTLVLVAVLVIIAIYMFSTLQTSMLSSTGAATNASVATGTMITQFGSYPALVGLVVTIIFLALVIGVLVASFAFGGKRGV